MNVVLMNENRIIKSKENKIFGYVCVPAHRIGDIDHKRIKEIKRELQKGYMAMLSETY